MLPLRFARQWQLASVVLLLLVLTAAVLPAIWFLPDRVRILDWFGGVDKWAHVTVFAILTVWFAGQYARRAYWRIAVGLLAYGLLIELVQSLLSYRSAEMPDIIADGIGIAIGLVIAAIWAGGWCQWFESWYVGRRVGAGAD